MRMVRLLPLVVLGILVACITPEGFSESPLSPLSPLPSRDPHTTPSPSPWPTWDPRATPPQSPRPPLPSPTATSSIWPLLTPSNLRAWPTSTPTPLPPPAERARQFVADQQGVPADRLKISWQQHVRLPTTGEELWAGRFLNVDTGQHYYVWMDVAGRAGDLPDLSEQALAQVAEQERIPAEQLVVVNTTYATYPFTQQLIWMAKILDSQGDGWFSRSLDLEGNPVDVAAIAAAEASAIERQCPKLDEGLCLSFLWGSSEELYDVWIAQADPADWGVVARWLEQAGYPYTYHSKRIRTRLPERLIWELTALEGVTRVVRDWPARRVPLDSNLLFSFEETGGQVTLQVRTEKEYGCYNFQVAAELVHSGPQGFEIAIAGIHQPELCQEMVGPATWEVALGSLAGVYELTFSYADLRDRYRLTVAPESITAEAQEATFTWPLFAAWLRLPVDAVWFAVQAPTVNAQGTQVAPERSAYEERAGAFFAALEERGAVSFVPPEGVYSHRSFIPPWPGWWRSRGGWVEIPNDQRGFYLFVWPDIRYYRYPEPDQLVALVQAFSSEGLWITGHTWEGESFSAAD